MRTVAFSAYAAILVGLAVGPPAQDTVSWSVTLDSRYGLGLANQGGPAGPLVVFGGATSPTSVLDDTWGQLSSGWSRQAVFDHPTARTSPGFAPFSRGTHSGAVLFGGRSAVAVPISETCEWSGDHWGFGGVAPAGLHARDRHAMAFDSRRSVVVMFGGLGTSGALDDTWEWTPSLVQNQPGTWTQRLPQSSPPPRFGHCMAFDRQRSRMVLFGGNGPTNDTWELDIDQNRWVQIPTPPGNTPEARWRSALAFDVARQRLVLFGGMDAGNHLRSDTWTYDGDIPGWVRQSVATSPEPRMDHALGFDPTRASLVLVGGSDGNQVPQPGPWSWDGVSWQKVSNPPEPRILTPMVYHPGRAEFVLFGGALISTGQRVGGTFILKDSVWRAVVPARSPVGRYSHSMIYDERRGAVILHGGATPTGPVNDTWEWDGTSWTELLANGCPGCPPLITSFTMCYDSNRQRAVGLGTSSGTWEWDGSVWLQVSSVAPGPRRGYFGLAYDQRRQRSVLFGGYDGSYYNDTWEWDGSQWAQRSPANRPSARAFLGMVYDSFRERCVVYGGIAQGGIRLQDLWEWDGADWVQRRPSGGSPGPRAEYALAYDSGRHETVLWGGSDGGVGNTQTWIYAPTAEPAFRVGGMGCVGSAGLPSLALSGGVQPWLGDTYQVRTSPVPSPGASVLVLGASDATWNGLSLPLDLSLLGMPGCRLYLSLDVLIPFANSNPIVPLTIPNDGSLLGANLFHQTAILDTPANPLGLIWSNLGTATIGAR